MSNRQAVDVNNTATIIGTVVSNFEFSHEVFGEGFYTIDISVNRLSNQADIIPLTVSERLVDVTEDYRGCMVEITGQFRSYNRREGAKSRLILSLFVKQWYSAGNVQAHMDENTIYLNGFICKPPMHRKTPLGREIADLLIAVNRPYDKSDYIPCIAWGENARYAATFAVGSKIEIWGRLQSREYMKKISETEEEKRIAYEVSIHSMSLIMEEENGKKEN